MTKTDKQFFTRLIKGLDQKLSRRIKGLDQKLSGRIDGLDQKLSGRIDGLDGQFNSLDQKIDKVRDELLTEIRHEGVLRERSDHNIEILAEGYQALNERLERMEKGMGHIQEKTDLIPVLWSTVKDHSRRLTVLEKR